MVHNPLYDRSGPEYEIVPPRPETSTPFTQPVIDEMSANHPAANQHYDTINTPGLPFGLDTTAEDTSHYIDPPLHTAHLSSVVHPYLQMHTCMHPPYDTISGSTTSSVPTTSLKKNGQERNKLHLTLSLRDHRDLTVGTATSGNNHGVMVSDTNDNYTIMNPITARQNIGCKSVTRITRQQENSVLYSV